MGEQGATGAPGLAGFRSAGRTLFSLGLVKEAEGNLSTFDGNSLVITRAGAELANLSEADVVMGGLDGELPDATSDLEVHRTLYRGRGGGAVAHAHPPGTVPADGGGPGEHGVYAFAGTLAEAVEALVASARQASAEGAGR
jgi:ribulose-5-phosphate 4-epimerase/fuculose-1-phosphate aldolase